MVSTLTVPVAGGDSIRAMVEPTCENHPSLAGGHPSLPASAVLRRCHLQPQTLACRGRSRLPKVLEAYLSALSSLMTCIDIPWFLERMFLSQ